MTPSARLQAAIEILDLYLAGSPVEKALTNWARRSRYAGSKDRAAVRDIVFQCVRCRSSYAYRGGSETGRGLAIGYAAENQGGDLFEGGAYGADELSPEEVKSLNNKAMSGDLHVNWDAPEWLVPSLTKALGDATEPVLKKLRSRAPVFVRVNLSRETRDSAIKLLAKDGIIAQPNAMSAGALEVVEKPRKLNNSNALRDGIVELQDAASQAVCQTLPVENASRILDYCAGGGGKSLALADRTKAKIFAHDVNTARMGDIAQRAKRAGVTISTLETSELTKAGPFDMVFCDVPCSGTGAWRRSPEGKWSLTREKLDALLDVQAEIMHEASKLVAPNGVFAYATCSMLCEENEDQVAEFLKKSDEWELSFSKRFSPLDGGDGFYVAHLTHKA